MLSRRDMLAAAYDAFNARDIEAVLAMMHPDVNWPNGLEGGRLRGRAEIREYWRRQWDRIDPRVEPVRFEDDALGRTVVHVRQVVWDLAGHIVTDEVVQHVYTIHAGLIERMDIRTPDTGPWPRVLGSGGSSRRLTKPIRGVVTEWSGSPPWSLAAPAARKEARTVPGRPFRSRGVTT
jgi:hypothetical protein